MRLMSFNYPRAVEHGMKKSLISNLILLRSNPYTHSEIEFSDGISFSSTMQDKVGGTRFKDIDYTKHPERWDSVDIPVSVKNEKALYRVAVSMVGMKYDLLGLLSFATPFSIIVPNANKVWCSEACGYLIKLVYDGLDIVPDKTHPTRLHEASQEYFCPEEIE